MKGGQQVKFVNLPTDWSKRYIVLGYGMSMVEVTDILKMITAKDDDGSWSARFNIIAPAKPGGMIEFIPLEEE